VAVDLELAVKEAVVEVDLELEDKAEVEAVPVGKAVADKVVPADEAGAPILICR